MGDKAKLHLFLFLSLIFFFISVFAATEFEYALRNLGKCCGLSGLFLGFLGVAQPSFLM